MMSSNLEAMLENDKHNLNDRIVNLERRVQQQDNELVCLKSTIADLIRRLQQVEHNQKNCNSTVIGSSSGLAAPLSTSKLGQIHNRTVSATNKNSTKLTNEKLKVNLASGSTRRAGSQTDLSSQTTVSVNKPNSGRKSVHQKEKKETSFLFNEENNTVRMFLRGRPVTFFMPDNDHYDFELKIKAPKEQLKLEWVYGYRGKDCRSNLYQLPTGEIVYFIAATVVLYNIDENIQRHYIEHTDDIKSLAIHPDGVTIATGQVAGHEINEGKPHIRIWNSVNLNTIQIIGLNLTGSDTFQNGISCLSFSKADGGLQLCAVDDGGERILSVWNWQNNIKITSTKCYGDLVFAAEYHPTEKNYIISCGKQHVFFWQIENSHLNKKTGVFDSVIKVEKPKYVLCIGFLPNGEVITGDSEGSILFWNYKEAKVIKQIKDAHEGGVFSILVTNLDDVSFISGGGKDGKIVEWNKEYQKSGRFLQIPDNNGTCRFISQGNGNLYLIGTTKNCILRGNFDMDLRSIVNGHTDELWGLAVNPNDSAFITCANDKLLCYWDLLTHSLLWSLSLDDQQSGAHCAHFHPFKNILAVGFTKNKWSVYDLNERKCIFSQIEGTEQIECIKYSPNGQYLAAGSRDNIIYIYKINDNDATKYSRIGRCIGHSSFITQLDWSIDNKYIMSNSGDYEILYWEVETCKQIINISELIRNVEWATNNCILTPNSFGIWNAINIDSKKQENNSQQLVTMDGTDINSVCLSNSKLLLASGDDYGKINIYSYPCNTNKCEKRSYGGHSSHVTNVKFLNDDRRILSTGGNDMSIFEWSISND